MEQEFLYKIMSEKENELQNRVLKIISENDHSLEEKLMNALKKTDEETRLRIAFVGQHNAGKSTIVSALTSNKDIRISSNVETDTTTTYEWGDVILYDTPGLYAGVKSEHDHYALKAISEADLLVFCITSSLFDDLLIANFVELAYKRAYKNKIILLVNKMSQESGEFDVLRNNYLHCLEKTLEELGGELSDFPIAFVDAKDYKDGLDDDDEELIEYSNFNCFIELLNNQIVSKGLYAKITTKCNILLDAISEAIATTSTDKDKNMIVILNRLSRTIRNYKKEMRYELCQKETACRSGIMAIADTMIAKIGQETITEEVTNDVNLKIGRLTEEKVEEIEQKLSEVNEEMMSEIGEVLSSDIGLYVFGEINSDSYREDSVTSKDYNNFLEKYGNAAKMIKAGGEKIANMALKDGAIDFVKLANVAGGDMHKIVLNVGHFFGKAFKPWEAVKVAQRIGKVANCIGPAMAVLDIALVVAGKINDENEIKKCQEQKMNSFNQFSDIASDIINQIDEQYAKLEKDAFDVKEYEITKIRENMISEADNNSEYVRKLQNEQKELSVLLDSLMYAVNESKMA